MTLMEDVAALQARVAEAERAKARAEGARDSAQTALDKARQELREEFGIQQIEQAEQMLADLRDELQRLVTEISAKLDEIGV